MKILTVANQKGGVAKTTTVAHLAYLAIERGLRVLLVDVDVQNSLGGLFPVTTDGTHLCASMLFDENPSDLLPEPLTDGLAIIRADVNLVAVEQKGAAVRFHLKKRLRRFADEYDLCLIDTPPFLGVNLVAALCAADAALTPSKTGYLDMLGVGELIKTIGAIKRGGQNRHLKYLGILPVQINSRSPRDLAALAKLQADYGDVVLPYYVTKRSAIEQAAYRQKPVWHGGKDGSSHKAAAEEMRRVCSAILDKVV